MIRKVYFLSMSSLAVIGLLLSTQSFSAKSKWYNYKNELINNIPCPRSLMLSDGLYLGAALGYDAYRVGDEVGFAGGGNIATWDAILNPVGINGGGFIGYGRYLSNFFNIYLGAEAFGLASNAQTSYDLVASTSISGPVVLSTDVDIKTTYGVSLLPGIKLNTGSLLYLRLGYNFAKVNVDQNIVDHGSVLFDGGESNVTQGFNYGFGIETALYQNLSLRFEYNHTDYNSFETELETRISPADNQLLLGLLYHFNKRPPMISSLTPCETLKQGWYFGVAAGYDSYGISDKIAISSPDSSVFANVNPEISANGVVGGGIFGYGKYFNPYNIYLGLEIFGNGTEASVTSTLSAQPAGSTTANIIKSKININSNYGIGLLPGIKFNEATLFYLRAGYNWAVVRSEEEFTSETGAFISDNTTKTVRGLNYGLGLEFATSNNNLTVRTEFSHTNYSSFDWNNLTISPSDNQYMLGLIYHFV